MIEDALKSTRMLHRLILAVSFVTLVFSLSMRPASEQREYKAAIDALLDIDFSSYSTWLQPTLDAQIQELMLPAVKPVRDHLENGSHLIFNLDDIAESLEMPAHTGRLLIEELILTDMPSASISQLNALNGLSLGHDIQILVPQVEPLLPVIEDFLIQNPDAGRRVSNVQTAIDVDTVEFNAESFLPGSSVTAALYFELVDAVSIGSAPVFQASFDANIITIPNTSFLFWVEQTQLTPHIDIRNGQLLFAPSLTSAPRGYQQDKLGLLSLRLDDEIKSAGPEQKSATFLGTEIPGLLIVLAAPLILMALVYYLFNHTVHIARLVNQHAVEMANFAWLPLSMKSVRIWGTDRRLDVHTIELFVGAALLPIVALAIMYWKLLEFGNVSIITTLLLLVAVIWISGFWWFQARAVNGIRAAIRNVVAAPPGV